MANIDTSNIQSDYLGQKGLYNIGALTIDELAATIPPGSVR